MKALLLKAYGQFVYEEASDPQVAEDEVLIEVRACGICGSDVHGMDGSTGRRRPPIIMGHEASAIYSLDDLPENLKNFAELNAQYYN